MKKIAGYGLLGLVFGGVFAASALERGLVDALIIWGGALAITATIGVGVRLIVDG